MSRVLVRVGEVLVYAGMLLLILAIAAVVLLYAVGVAHDLFTPPTYDTMKGAVTNHRVDTVAIDGNVYSFYYVTINGIEYEVAQDDYRRIDVGDWVKYKVRANGVFRGKIVVEVVE